MSRTRNRFVEGMPGPYEAIVIGHLDPSYMGGLKVELLRKTATGNEPERTGQLLEARYMSPFYGVTPQAQTTGNSGYKDTQKSYGMWMVPPDVGTRVIVILIEGNISQCYWIGCIQDEYMNFMTPGYASTKQVESLTGDATGQIAKKVPVAEYNKRRETGTTKSPTKFLKPPHTEIAKTLVQQGLLDDDIRGLTSSSARREAPSMVFGVSTPGPIDKRPGAPKAETGARDAKARKFINRLGGSSFVMDDGDDKLLRKGPAGTTPPEYENVEALAEGEINRGDVTLPANELVRIKTRTGHQILLHNTEDLIYIGNAKGTSWIELTSNGKIDIYARDSVSIHSATDLNFTADRDINFTAGGNVNTLVGKEIRNTSGESINNIAGTTISSTAGLSISETAETSIENYAKTKATYQSGSHTNILAGENLNLQSGSVLGAEATHSIKMYSEGEGHFTFDQQSFLTSAGAQFSFGDNFVVTSEKDFVFSSDNAFNSTVRDWTLGSREIRAEGTNYIELNGKARIGVLSKDGPVELRAQTEVKMQAITGDILQRANNNVKVWAKNNNIELHAQQNIKMWARSQDITLKASANIFSNAGSAIRAQAGGTYTVKSGGNMTFTAPKIDHNGPDAGAVSITDPTPSPIYISWVKWPICEPNLTYAAQPASIPPLPLPSSPTPAVYADRVARIPMHEPWYQHENLNPLSFTPDKTRAGTELAEAYNPQIPDTFATFPIKQDTLGTLRISGIFDNDKYINALPAAGEIIGYETFSKEMIELGFEEDHIKAAVAVCMSEYGSFKPTNTDVVPTKRASENELDLAHRVKKLYTEALRYRDKNAVEFTKLSESLFFEQMYGHLTRYGKQIGNTEPGDGFFYRGQGYILNVHGKGGFQRYETLIRDNHGIVGSYTSVDTAAKLAALYLKDYYKDHGRGILGNMRIAIAGTVDYYLGTLRDKKYWKELGYGE